LPATPFGGGRDGGIRVVGCGKHREEFDLETNRRIAEFKFIHWRGGPESIRQNQLFKDFYLLSESPSPKRKYLYVLGTKHPLKFFNGGRALSSVLSRNHKLLKQFEGAHGEKFETVRDYFLAHKNLVEIEDVSGWVPELISDSDEELRLPSRLLCDRTRPAPMSGLAAAWAAHRAH
jgi:hypothetical protein